jgi:hypothetical protein
MTVCGQNLNPDDSATLKQLLTDDPKGTAAALANNVKAAIDILGGGRHGQLQADIDDRTRAFIHSPRPAVEDIIDQSFDRKLVEVVDKAITDALAERSDEFRSEIVRVVQKAVDAKLSHLKDKALARTKRRRRK